MTAPTIVDTTTTEFSGFTASNFYTVDIGTIAENNLILILAWSADISNSTLFSISGYTKLFEEGNDPSNACECKVAAWWKLAGASETDPNLVSTGSNDYMTTRVHEISGQNASPIDFTPVTAMTTGGSAASFSVLGDNTVTADCIVFGGNAFQDGSITATISGTGWSETFDGAFSDQNFEVRAVEFQKTMSGTGATGTVTVTPSSNAESAWFQIAIAPTAVTYVPTKRGTSGGIQSLNGGMQ